MIKKTIYILGLIALGFVIFNNTVQTTQIIKINPDYMIGLVVSMIAGIFYGIINLK